MFKGRRKKKLREKDWRKHSSGRGKNLRYSKPYNKEIRKKISQ